MIVAAESPYYEDLIQIKEEKTLKEALAMKRHQNRLKKEQKQMNLSLKNVENEEMMRKDVNTAENNAESNAEGVTRVDAGSQKLERLWEDSLSHSLMEKAALLVQEKKKEARESISVRSESFHVVPKKSLREADRENMARLKTRFRVADLQRHIRRGNEEDYAYLAPALIPIPKAFESDGSNPMVSHIAEQTVHNIKQKMTLADIGYTPQQMVPLYARLTLMEQNGVSPGGDQNYESMAKDRRYTHYLGRSINRFEPDQTLQHNASSSALGYGEKTLKNQKDVKLLQKERVSELVFDKSMPSLAELRGLEVDY